MIRTLLFFVCLIATNNFHIALLIFYIIALHLMIFCKLNSKKLYFHVMDYIFYFRLLING